MLAVRWIECWPYHETGENLVHGARGQTPESEGLSWLVMLIAVRGKPCCMRDLPPLRCGGGRHRHVPLTH